ncbi:hypothetical protein CMV_019803, partial [Castanea mollissima]
MHRLLQLHLLLKFYYKANFCHSNLFCPNLCPSCSALHVKCVSLEFARDQNSDFSGKVCWGHLYIVQRLVLYLDLGLSISF